MVQQRVRNSDNGDENGYQKRRAFDYKTLLVIATALVGSGGITGAINALTNPRLQTQIKVEALEEKVETNNDRAKANAAAIINRTQRVEDYILSHDKEETLRQKITDQEFEHIKQLLKEISADIKTIKNKNR